MSAEPTKDLAARCIDLYKRHDMPFVASVLGIEPIDVSRILRRARVATDVQPHELSYIVAKVDVMPARAIAEYLGLSPSQLDQILRRHDIRKKAEGMTLQRCVASTRWLIETRLKLPVDDRLPRLITNEHFTDNKLNAVVEFATESKVKCPTARHFSACAFLVDQAYPGRFQPWQFRHSKQNQYFVGKAAHRNFLSALMWLIEKKHGVTPEALPYAMSNRSFLSTRTLQDFGLGPNWWRPLWPSKEEMLEALAKHAGVAPAGLGERTVARDRTQLRAAGIDPGCCAVPGCTSTGVRNIEIHHIVRRATRIVGHFDLRAVENLVPLCRRHHGIAGRIRPAASLLRSPFALRPWLIEKLGAEGDAPPAGKPQGRAAPNGGRKGGDTAARASHA